MEVLPLLVFKKFWSSSNSSYSSSWDLFFLFILKSYIIVPKVKQQYLTFWKRINTNLILDEQMIVNPTSHRTLFIMFIIISCPPSQGFMQNLIVKPDVNHLNTFLKKKSLVKWLGFVLFFFTSKPSRYIKMQKILANFHRTPNHLDKYF